MRKYRERKPRSSPSPVCICILGNMPICLACGMVMIVKFRRAAPIQGMDAIDLDGAFTAMCANCDCLRKNIQYELPSVAVEAYEP